MPAYRLDKRCLLYEIQQNVVIGLSHVFPILILKRRCLLSHVVRTVATTSLLHHHRNPQVFYLADSRKTSFLAIWIAKKPISRIHDVIIVQEMHGVLVPLLHLYKGSVSINTFFLPLSTKAERCRTKS